jgi:hypothetical protein
VAPFVFWHMTISKTRSLLASWARDNIFLPMRPHRSIAIGVALSLLVHGLLLLLSFPRLTRNEGAPTPMVQGPLEVRLSQAAPLAPPPTQAALAPPPPTPAATPPRDRPPKPRPAHRRNPVITVPKPTPHMPPMAVEELAPPPVATPQPSVAPPMDFMESILAKRRATEAAVAHENAQAQANSRDPSANDIAMANINRNLQTMSRQRDGVSGVFQILSKGIRTAEFSFRGWTTDERSNWRAVYEVDAGLHGDIELATVRKMIELIRTHYQGDFNWESRRLGRVVVLSARIEDNAELEAYLIREFFGVHG